jgi:hypothetical protein
LDLFAFCAGLLLLLSSRPADAAERREPRLLDPVGTTLKATAREVDSFAGRATGSGSSTVARTADAARQAVAPPPRGRPPARPVPRSPRPSSGAPRRSPPCPPGRAPRPSRSPHPPGRCPGRQGRRRAVERAAGVRRCGPVDDRGNLARRCATLPHRGSEHGAGSLEGARFLAPVVGLIGPILRPLGPALAPVGSAWRRSPGRWAGWPGRWFPAGCCRYRRWSVPNRGRRPVPRPGSLPLRSQVSRAPGRPQASHPRPRRIRSVWPPTAPARPPSGPSGPGRP